MRDDKYQTELEEVSILLFIFLRMRLRDEHSLTFEKAYYTASSL
jgi:hypothetical protein